MLFGFSVKSSVNQGKVGEHERFDPVAALPPIGFVIFRVRQWMNKNPLCQCGLENLSGDTTQIPALESIDVELDFPLGMILQPWPSNRAGPR